MYPLLVNLALFFIHDFFVSVSYIEYDDQRNAIEAHKKIFFDDFEQTLKKQSLNEDFDILKSNQVLVDDYIKDYLTNNIEFVINDKQYDFEYLGHEYEDGMINCYFEIKKIKKIKKIKIKDTSLFETFEGQENLIYFQANQKLTTIRLKDPILFHEIIIK
ncbi:MAG: DUF6702 family protein [Bacteroidota bacterium]|jgi:hypothetical protein|nr:DUF6702 family protein [Bacteroidota bacterium]|tara:strand:+ start:7856 stop:8335 length:480 start_codon:yes stop_codon:yes gene_type:complete